MECCGNSCLVAVSTPWTGQCFEPVYGSVFRCLAQVSSAHLWLKFYWISNRTLAIRLVTCIVTVQCLECAGRVAYLQNSALAVKISDRFGVHFAYDASVIIYSNAHNSVAFVYCHRSVKHAVPCLVLCATNYVVMVFTVCHGAPFVSQLNANKRRLESRQLPRGFPALRLHILCWVYPLDNRIWLVAGEPKGFSVGYPRVQW